MSRIANRRALLISVQSLVHARQPEAGHYAKVLAALSLVASDDFEGPMEATLDPEKNDGLTIGDTEAAIRKAVADYHYALDTRQHGGVAQDTAFNAICKALGMYWQQGAEKARREAAKESANG